MSEQDNRQIVKDFYSQILLGNVEEVLTRFLAPDIVWENPLPEPIPFGGTFHGRDGVRRYLEMIFAHVEIKEFPITEHLVQGDTVVVLGSEASLVKTTGRSYRMDWVHVLRIANGRIRQLREYNDTAAMAAAFSRH
ncbi:MAG: nuclear transport factor 2 family protein [Gammaproteobacteria bacterium]